MAYARCGGKVAGVVLAQEKEVGGGGLIQKAWPLYRILSHSIQAHLCGA